jgi:hypothetical protein
MPEVRGPSAGLSRDEGGFCSPGCESRNLTDAKRQLRAGLGVAYALLYMPIVSAKESVMNTFQKLVGAVLLVVTCGMLASCVVEARRPYYARWHRPAVYVVR